MSQPEASGVSPIKLFISHLLGGEQSFDVRPHCQSKARFLYSDAQSIRPVMGSVEY